MGNSRSFVVAYVPFPAALARSGSLLCIIFVRRVFRSDLALSLSLSPSLPLHICIINTLYIIHPSAISILRLRGIYFTLISRFLFLPSRVVDTPCVSSLSSIPFAHEQTRMVKCPSPVVVYQEENKTKHI